MSVDVDIVLVFFQVFPVLLDVVLILADISLVLVDIMPILNHVLFVMMFFMVHRRLRMLDLFRFGEANADKRQKEKANQGF
jgi:hypothetical protein